MDILKMSFFASILIIVLIAIRKIFMKILPKRTFAVLWGVAVCRLLIPYSIASKFSIYNIIKIKEYAPSKVQAPISHFVNNIPDSADNIQKVSQQTVGMHNFISLAIIIWVIGIIICMATFIITHIKCCREYNESLPIKDNYINQWITENKIKRNISVRQSDKINTPLTYKLFNPVILLPKSLNLEDKEQLKYILAHEFIHVKHYHILFKYLLAIACSVHWFNPIVWIMYKLANRDLELICDECVLRLLGEDNKYQYALSLINNEERKLSTTPFCYGFNKCSIEERLVCIMKIKKMSIIWSCIAIMLMTSVSTVFGTTLIPEVSEVKSFIGKNIIDLNKLGDSLDLAQNLNKDNKADTKEEANNKVEAEVTEEKNDENVVEDLNKKANKDVSYEDKVEESQNIDKIDANQGNGQASERNTTFDLSNEDSESAKLWCGLIISNSNISYDSYNNWRAKKEEFINAQVR